jgi:anti-sigma factor RsiW
MANALTCQELVEIITEYLDNALSAPDRLRFEDHIRDCENCAAYLNQIRETIRLTGMLSEDQIAPGAKDELLNLFRDWHQGQ